MDNRMIRWLGLALVGLACARSPSHPCRSNVECAVGWSCVDQYCQPESSQDGPADRTSATDLRDHDDARDAGRSPDAQDGAPMLDVRSDAVDADARPDGNDVPDVAPDTIPGDAAPDAPADVPEDRASDSRPSSPWNYVFVTSKTYPLMYGTLDAPDLFCNLAATDAGLPGNYRAWLSSTQVDARDRLVGARGWVRTDGLPFADTIDDIAAGHIFHPPLVDENVHEIGDRVADFYVVTGTNGSGRLAAGNNCNDWKAQGLALFGLVKGTTDLWTNGAFGSCGGAMHIYCFGIDKDAPLTPPFASGKRAFLSDGYFAADSGIGGADTLCAGEATAAGFTGQFKALLATSSQSAASRFTSTPDTVWVRPDGIPVNAVGVNLFAGSPLLTALNVTSRMKYVGNDGVFVGAVTPMSVGTLATTCSDWQSVSPQQRALMGRAGFSEALFAPPTFTDSTTECSLKQSHIYCLED